MSSKELQYYIDRYERSKRITRKLEIFTAINVPMCLILTILVHIWK